MSSDTSGGAVELSSHQNGLAHSEDRPLQTSEAVDGLRDQGDEVSRGVTR